MASWKNVIVSGSRADLTDVTASYYSGDGSSVTNVVAASVANALSVDDATLNLNSGTTYNGSGAVTISVKDGGVDADALAAAVAGDGLTGGAGSALAVGAGTGIDVAADAVSVDVSDFMDNGANNRIVTAKDADSLNAEATLTYDGSILLTTGIISGSNVRATGHISGSLISGSFYGDGSNITGVTATALDIDAYGSDLTSATLLTSDLIIVSDGGTDGRANIGDLAAPLAGTGLEASSNTIRIAAGAAGTGLSGGAGSALAVDLSGESAVSIGAGTSEVTIGDNLTVNGDLTIYGDTVQQQVSNLLVEDKFILLNSGSAAGDGGIIVQTDASFNGAALVFDDDINRWAVGAEDKLAQNATSVDSTAAGFQYIVSVSGSALDPNDGSSPDDFGTAHASRIGLMHVNTTTGDIFIYS